MSESVFCAHQHVVFVFFQIQCGRTTRGYDRYELLLIPLKGVKSITVCTLHLSVLLKIFMYIKMCLTKINNSLVIKFLQMNQKLFG